MLLKHHQLINNIPLVFSLVQLCICISQSEYLYKYFAKITTAHHFTYFIPSVYLYQFISVLVITHKYLYWHISKFVLGIQRTPPLAYLYQPYVDLYNFVRYIYASISKSVPINYYIYTNQYVDFYSFIRQL